MFNSVHNESKFIKKYKLISTVNTYEPLTSNSAIYGAESLYLRRIIAVISSHKQRVSNIKQSFPYYSNTCKSAPCL